MNMLRESLILGSIEGIEIFEIVGECILFTYKSTCPNCFFKSISRGENHILMGMYILQDNVLKSFYYLPIYLTSISDIKKSIHELYKKKRNNDSLNKIKLFASKHPDKFYYIESDDTCYEKEGDTYTLLTENYEPDRLIRANKTSVGIINCILKDYVYEPS